MLDVEIAEDREESEDDSEAAMPAPAADCLHRYWHKFTIGNFSWKIRIISAAPMKISAATDMEMMAQRRLNIGISAAASGCNLSQTLLLY